MQRFLMKTTLMLSALICLPWLTWADASGFLGEPNASEREQIIHGHDLNHNNHGFSFEAAYTGEVVRNFDAGLVQNSQETMYLDNLNITLTLDTEQAGLWSGGTFFMYVLGNQGDNPSEDVLGDLQTASNIETTDTLSLYELWYEQQFSDTFSILFGFHDLNSEFYVSEYSSLFFNSTPGIGAEMSGNVPLSIFAKTGLALRLHYDPTDTWYIQSAMYDGDPETRGLASDEGELYIIETGIHMDTDAFKLGYWTHTANVMFNGSNYSENNGYYAIVDYQLLNLGEDRSLGVFIRWGEAASDRNFITGHREFGLHAHGLISSRGEDDIGFAYIQANTTLDDEVVYELTYRAVITDWLVVQPSWQSIHNPGADASNAVLNVGLLRVEVAI